MRVQLLEEAIADLVDGHRFYEERAEGLGEYFLEALFADLESLRFYGGMHPTYFGYRRLLAKRFPFAVYYRVDGDTIRVHAVLDCRRDPAWTRKRLI